MSGSTVSNIESIRTTYMIQSERLNMNPIDLLRFNTCTWTHLLQHSEYPAFIMRKTVGLRIVYKEKSIDAITKCLKCLCGKTKDQNQNVV